jgi:RHS repeat-associated protein
VRQLADVSGEVVLARAYDPYGVTAYASGASRSTYGFTGEYATNDLVYLRARFYAAGTGRFLTRDAWSGDANRPMSFNRWGYTYENPVNLTDPSGHDPWWCEKSPNPAKCYSDWIKTTQVNLQLLFGEQCTPEPTSTQTSVPIATWTATPLSTDQQLAMYGVAFTGNLGGWKDTKKVAVNKAVQAVANKIADTVGGSPIGDFRIVYGYIDFEWCDNCIPHGYGFTANDHLIKFDYMYPDIEIATRLVVHELGHLFDRAVCASNHQGNCHDAKGNELIWGINTARSDLTGKTGTCLGPTCLGRKGHEGPGEGEDWGFAGKFEVWQFGMNDAEGYGENGELWADMFLGWTFGQWGDDTRGGYRQNYMNDRMKYHLHTNFNFP